MTRIEADEDCDRRPDAWGMSTEQIVYNFTIFIR